MSVRLISITKPCIDATFNGESVAINTPEDLIVWIARVSNPNNKGNFDTSAKLIRYLIKHKHWSPFEMVSASVEIKCERYVAQQIIRHRSFTFQEFSLRYANATNVRPVELRRQATKNRQSSTDLVADEELDELVKSTIEDCQDCYQRLIGAGVARECARAVLPLSTETTIIMNGSLRSFYHYIELRTAPDTQKEHRDIALAIREILSPLFPNIFPKSE